MSKASSKTHKLSIQPDKKGRRSFAGERGQIGGKAVVGKKGGTGGAYNWGSGMDYDEQYYQEDYDYDEDDAWADAGGSALPPSATIQQKAAAAQARRQAQVAEADAEAAEYSRVQALASSKSAWGQQGRLDTLKQKLLQKEVERINAMSPDRLELLSILDESGVQLPNKAIEALLAWKRRNSRVFIWRSGRSLTEPRDLHSDAVLNLSVHRGEARDGRRRSAAEVANERRGRVMDGRRSLPPRNGQYA
eukprot:CAMPEP_0182536782 /NCGR_PEP_ID=MMETSP1323-20130603/20730_1 /TAXON_ID=236787 /ORGANISM="Florenciella parvula, Strain RCC1693" /LENGTH=247 /DNA_ID=CAMNT_0024747057 /DNA_START=38 /DNA_END=782 /DNA_ORIENTATION=-